MKNLTNEKIAEISQKINLVLKEEIEKLNFNDDDKFKSALYFLKSLLMVYIISYKEPEKVLETLYLSMKQELPLYVKQLEDLLQEENTNEQ